MDTEKHFSLELKQNFLSSAITDISAYIQLTDTKVSILMGAIVALIVGGFACYEPIGKIISKINPCSWIGIILVIFIVLLCLSVVFVFAFGLLTVKWHSSDNSYKSKWFLLQNTKIYTSEAYLKDINAMSDEDIIENMAIELYKLNDINRQKYKTMKLVTISFACSIGFAIVISLLLVASLI